VRRGADAVRYGLQGLIIIIIMLLLLLSCAAGKGGAPTADDIPDDELAEDIYAGEEDELRPERPDKVRGAGNFPLTFFPFLSGRTCPPLLYAL
jgi:hypothetical protein